MYSMQIDGGIMDHPIYGFAIVNVSQDAVQEFRVLRNQFDAEYSRAGTAVVNVVTRSGTNDLHGPAVVLRPRRLAEREERLRPHQAAVRRGPLQRRRRRTARAQQGVLLRHLRIQPPELGAHHRPAGRQPVRQPVQRRLRQRHAAPSSARRRSTTRPARSTPSASAISTTTTTSSKTTSWPRTPRSTSRTCRPAGTGRSARRC